MNRADGVYWIKGVSAPTIIAELSTETAAAPSVFGRRVCRVSHNPCLGLNIHKIPPFPITYKSPRMTAVTALNALFGHGDVADDFFTFVNVNLKPSLILQRFL